MASDELESRCNFVPLFSLSFPHILERIIFSLDYKSYKNCLEVSNEWKGVLTSERYQTTGKSVFKKEIRNDVQKLHEAAERGKICKVKRLLASGMLNVNTSILKSPLYLAAEKGHKEVVQLLIEHGADPNMLNVDVHHECSLTPLYIAAEKGYTEIAILLVECGADPNRVDDIFGPGYAPLHRAAEYGYKDLAVFLVERGADTNVVDRYGDTPLHKAAQKGHKEVVQLLIDSAARVNLGNICRLSFL